MANSPAGSGSGSQWQLRRDDRGNQRFKTRHAVIHVAKGNSFFVEDVSSGGGVEVNSKCVEKRQQLYPGDKIGLARLSSFSKSSKAGRRNPNLIFSACLLAEKIARFMLKQLMNKLEAFSRVVICCEFPAKVLHGFQRRVNEQQVGDPCRCRSSRINMSFANDFQLAINLR